MLLGGSGAHKAPRYVVPQLSPQFGVVAGVGLRGHHAVIRPVRKIAVGGGDKQLGTHQSEEQRHVLVREVVGLF